MKKPGTEGFRSLSPQETAARPFGSKPGLKNVSTRALAFVVAALLLQMLLILLASFHSGAPLAFVARPHFAWDLSDIVTAASDWSTGVNPYLRLRFVTPPPSLLVGALLERLTPTQAGSLFFAVNIVAVLASVWLVAVRFQVGRPARLLLLATAALYYPVYFLLERGNLDGLMLLLLCLFLFAGSLRIKPVLLAASIVFKVYSLALLPALVMRRRYRTAVATLICAVLLLLPFHAFLLSYLGALASRAQQITATENLSPAALLGAFSKHASVQLAYCAAWAGTLLSASWRQRHLPAGEQLLLLFPWMIAFPLQVYPYTGVLLLPVLVMRAGSTVYRAKRCATLCFLSGFLLTGTQQGALNLYFRSFVPSHRLFPALNIVGTVLVLVSSSLDPAAAALSPEIGTP